MHSKFVFLIPWLLHLQKFDFAVLKSGIFFKAIVKARSLFKKRPDTLEWETVCHACEAYNYTWLCLVLKVTKTNQVQKSIQ
jgi:hypothetical protein